MNIETSVPEAPAKAIVIPQEDQGRLDEWIRFFRNLSPRIRVVQPKDGDFGQFYEASFGKLRKLLGGLGREEGGLIRGWPEKERIAFGVACDSALPGSSPAAYGTGDIWMFCFGNRAFSLNHFEGDADPENNHFPGTYSLGGYAGELLEWAFIADLVIDKVRGLEDQVPQLAGAA